MFFFFFVFFFQFSVCILADVRFISFTFVLYDRTPWLIPFSVQSTGIIRMDVTRASVSLIGTYIQAIPDTQPLLAVANPKTRMS